jgi:hypothetical protein
VARRERQALVPLRPRERRRRPLPLVVAAVLVLLIGVVLGRLLLSPDGAERDTPRRVVEVPRSPSPNVDGPPASPERTPSGAARAAARALSALADPRLLTDRNLRRAVVSDIAPADYRAELAPLFDRTYRYLADTLGPDEVVLRMTPVGYRVEAFSPRRATVAVWQVTLLGSAERDPIAAWATSRAELVWSAGRWRVERFGADTPGPTPAVTAPASSTAPAEFVALARGLAPLVP